MLEIATEKSLLEALDLVHLKGSLNAYTSHDFDGFFHKFIRAGHKFFIIESSQLESISSSGLNSVIYLTEKIKHCGGTFAFCELGLEVDMLFSFLGIRGLFKIFSSSEEAIFHFQKIIGPQYKSNKNVDHGAITSTSTAQSVSIPRPPKYSQESEQKESQSAVEIFEVMAEPVQFPSSGPEKQKTTSIVPCDRCNLPLKVQIPGSYMCPGCGYQFKVKEQS